MPESRQRKGMNASPLHGKKPGKIAPPHLSKRRRLKHLTHPHQSVARVCPLESAIDKENNSTFNQKIARDLRTKLSKTMLESEELDKDVRSSLPKRTTSLQRDVASTTAKSKTKLTESILSSRIATGALNTSSTEIRIRLNHTSKASTEKGSKDKHDSS